MRRPTTLRPLMKPFPSGCAVVLVLLVGAPRAEAGTVRVNAPPVVVMIRAATNASEQRRERRLFDELGVVLDDFMLMALDAEQPNFARLPLADQIASVLPVAQANGAQIVVWLSFPLQNQVMLHLIALGSGRALVRTIESERSSVAESTMALMARELLGTAYLFEPPKEVPLQVRAVVQGVKAQLNVVETPTVVAPPPPAPPTGRWSLWLRADGNVPVSGQVDAAPGFRLSLGVERRLPARIDVALSAVGAYGAVNRPAAMGASMVSIGGGLSAFRGFGPGALTGGPFVSAGAHWSSFSVGAIRLSTVLPRFEAGAQARLEADRGPSFSAAVGVALIPLRVELQGADSQTLFRTALLEVFLSIGVGWLGL
ncbi:MAG: hypothetical protein Q8N26_21775 [Myxococcales bacterium]|nr:hypothetical protein [Myxococcales bacterium]